MIRGCSLDSGTLTTDTELVRMSHCGSFFFNEKYVHGCVQSCDDVDACNYASRTTPGLIHFSAIGSFIPQFLPSLLFLYSTRQTKLLHQS